MLLICNTLWWALSLLAIKSRRIWSFGSNQFWCFFLMFAERCFSGIVHNLLETSPARGFIIFRWLGKCIVYFLHQTLRVAGVSQFACVQLYGFHSSFLIAFFLILKMTLDLNIWWSVPQFDPRIVRVLQISILSRHLVMMKSIICPCRERGCVQVVHPSVWKWCWSLSDRTQCIVPIEALR